MGSRIISWEPHVVSARLELVPMDQHLETRFACLACEFGGQIVWSGLLGFVSNPSLLRKSAELSKSELINGYRVDLRAEQARRNTRRRSNVPRTQWLICYTREASDAQQNGGGRREGAV